MFLLFAKIEIFFIYFLPKNREIKNIPLFDEIKKQIFLIFSFLTNQIEVKISMKKKINLMNKKWLIIH